MLLKARLTSSEGAVSSWLPSALAMKVPFLLGREPCQFLSSTMQMQRGNEEQVHLADVTPLRGDGEVRPSTPQVAVRQLLSDGLEARCSWSNSDSVTVLHQPSRLCIPHPLDCVSPGYTRSTGPVKRFDDRSARGRT